MINEIKADKYGVIDFADFLSLVSAKKWGQNPDNEFI
jgi:Ca2+-binding EF-hand superfamily protein